MGKKRKIRTAAGDVIPAPGPLHKQIEKDKFAKPKGCLITNAKNQKRDDKQGKFVDAALSTKILREAHKQWEEEEGNGKGKELEVEEKTDDEEDFSKQAQELAEQNALNSDEEAEIGGFTADEKCRVGLTTTKKRSRQSKAEGSTVTHPTEVEGVHPAVVTLFTEVGNVMAKYRSGKVPKAFKMIPAMANWEQILELTCPENWSAAAMFQATRAFAATGTPAQCQKFNNLVLLPRLRDEIDESKKLNFHMYQCMFKAMFKPSAFFKGILLPLCKSGNCTLREALIFGSVLRKISIPQLHAAAALLSVAEMEYSGATSYILRVLIEKNHSLPFRALDGLVQHFLRMRSHQNDLPVIWHQSLLAFVECYTSEISAEQREALIELAKVHAHRQITPEVLRFLRDSESRNEESEANVSDCVVRDREMEF